MKSSKKLRRILLRHFKSDAKIESYFFVYFKSPSSAVKLISLPVINVGQSNCDKSVNLYQSYEIFKNVITRSANRKGPRVSLALNNYGGGVDKVSFCRTLEKRTTTICVQRWILLSVFHKSAILRDCKQYFNYKSSRYIR